jgi:transketolase
MSRAASCRNFAAERLAPEIEHQLRETARKSRGDILTMTTLAGCGHPGGSMSSIDMYTVLYGLAGVDPGDPHRPGRDRIVVSHGHTSPGVYAALGNAGFFPVDDAIAHFRQSGGPFEGHVERCVPGVEWSSGNLGQGLSAGCGMALAAEVLGLPSRVFVVMGDGEQQKGQIGEARRFAVKYRLSRLTVLVDLNGLQISGETARVMPQAIRANFASDGWRVLEIDGHDLGQIYAALRKAVRDASHCVAILARTVMGKGVSFMENVAKWHGQALDEAQLDQALAELGRPNELARYRALRRRGPAHLAPWRPPEASLDVAPGEPRLWTADKPTDNRSAWGKALEDVAALNRPRPGATPIAVFDCDLSSSVKTNGFADAHPDRFFQSGIMEHHTAVAAGAMSAQGVQVFWADFGVFGVDEVYNQQRINDINETGLKVVCTHVGTDVGEDGKTHHCIDYLGLLHNLYGFRVVIPADPNQTDRVVRWAAGEPGNCFIGMGRSKCPPVLRPDGKPFFGADYRFRYGRADFLRPVEGAAVAVATYGAMAGRAVQAADELAAEGIRVGVVGVPSPRDLDAGDLAAACAPGILVTYEDHNRETGLGAALAARILERDLHVRLVRLGVSAYATSGVPEDILRSQGLDPDSLKAVIRRLAGR